MKLNYYVVNPGGNITAIVYGKFIKGTKLKITKNILENNSTIEQVGFWTDVKNNNINAKLEMAGGEFCGNALRSLGALLACNKKRKFYFIKSSSIKMPIKLNSSINFSEIILKLDLIQYKKDVCYIPGIQHFLSKERFTILEAKKVLKEKKLLRNKASGVISYKNISADTYNINPIVYVRDTKTFYEESSCASGTLALAYMLYEKKGIKKLNVLQPSGFILKTSISKNEIKLGGQIVSIKKETILI
ncbi:hypothetical protein A3A03_03305 [Candidatus Nomurabacteria bacterium RIFCSPLOWO2_01_FULL_40_18]|uniref:Diaminopimelate epimerase n=1 Tax=Candidatus Nomurabacteria bacterium RIFCSPLOWO2_01_FULL_40_18 TaxID=1801773 RepID=A0A1F6XJW2_9BACT|nr:MAG: hypothetical protein A3A03_03305 [Candidatus Nomurabacteria bacterium RIFCSPLOWO2_01_FULL_40_18]